MKIETKFNIGDSVWGVDSDTFRRIVKCKPCSNTGKISIGGEELLCPKCNGVSTHAQVAGQKFYVSTFSAQVGQVRTEFTSSDFQNYSSANTDRLIIQYMLTETGVGSGRIWDEDRLFASKEEAQRFCEDKNGSLLPNECEQGKAMIGNYYQVL